MKVYIVTMHVDSECSYVIGVFSSKEKADKIAKTDEKNIGVEEIELDVDERIEA